MQIPFEAKMFLETKLFFHGYGTFNKPDIYSTAKTIVPEKNLANIEVDEGES